MRWPHRVVDALFLLGLLSVVGIAALEGLTEGGPAAGLFACGIGAALLLLALWRRRRPWIFLIGTVVAAAVFLWLPGFLPTVGQVTAAILIPLGIFTVEAYGGEGWARVWVPRAIVLAAAGLVATESPWSAAVLLVLYVSILGWATGVRTQRRYREELLARVAAAERERDLRAKQAVTEERNRIARDLHDLVSHSLAVVAIQAAGAERIADSDPAKAKDSLGVIARSARDALKEMRAMLDVLRDESDGSSRPSPQMSDLEDLAADLTQRGVPVHYTRTGETYPLDSGRELALFRVTQECLTNAVKHGGDGIEIDVEVRYRPREVDVLVRNTLGPPADTGSVPGAGSGQIGIRERLSMYGGSFTATSTTSHYEARANMPRPGEGQNGDLR